MLKLKVIIMIVDVFDRDGGLKRSQPKSSMMQKQQEEYSKKLKGE